MSTSRSASHAREHRHDRRKRRASRRRACARSCSTPSISSTATRPTRLRARLRQGGLRGGARWVVLCDTNGGTLPDEIERIVGEVTAHIPGANLGIHCHNDTENAVANSLAAVRAGARQIQGTLNGLGERCGNANLVSLIPTWLLKTDFETGVDARGSPAAHARLASARRAAQPRARTATPPMSANRPSPTRAGCMSRRSRRTRAPTSTSSRRWSATGAISWCRTSPGAPTSWRASAISGSRSMPTIRRSARWSRS